MKIRGKWGWFWYRNMDKLIHEEIGSLYKYKRYMYLLRLHKQLSRPQYGSRMIIQAEAQIIRLEMLREYLKERKERNKNG